MTEAVLGVDPAWTGRQPSGVALAARDAAGWRTVLAAPDVGSFLAGLAGEPVDWARTPLPVRPDPGQLVPAVRAAGYDPRVAAIDMPVSTRGRILARRTCDNLIASVFGRFKLAAHGPTIVENVLHADYPAAFAEQGFTLCVRHDCDAITPRLIEAYPHCVMLRLMRAKKRVPYKVSRSLSYWPGTTAAERAERILDTWRSIVTALEAELPGAAQALDLPMRATTLASLKRHEDALDALVCAWLATRFLDAREELVCLGDGETSAIWCPAPDG